MRQRLCGRVGSGLCGAYLIHFCTYAVYVGTNLRVAFHQDGYETNHVEIVYYSGSQTKFALFADNFVAYKNFPSLNFNPSPSSATKQ